MRNNLSQIAPEKKHYDVLSPWPRHKKEIENTKLTRIISIANLSVPSYLLFSHDAVLPHSIHLNSHPLRRQSQRGGPKAKPIDLPSFFPKQYTTRVHLGMS